MGVSGWNRLLAEKGWLPDTSHGKSCFCTTSLWMDLSVTVDQSNLRFSERIVAIPSGSELHIDGYCLCFHLYTVAYARNMDRVLYSKSNHQQRPCARYKNLQSLSQQQVRHLLPSFLPLKLLSDVTKEFIQMLLKHKMKIVVYWDGQKRYSFKPVAKGDKQAEDGDEQAELADKQAAEKQAEDDEKRDSFKQATDSKRQSSLDAEWSDFQQYCLYGRMPAVPTVCGWAKVLPKHRLFATQVLHALTVARVDMVFCDEEADHILAQAVRRKKHAYLVGFDSDFCFFPDVNYIPLSTLDASRNTVTACVIRRDTIAASLDLPDERAMIELAILMGNDYVNPTTAEFQNCSVAGNRNTNATLAFLREKGQGYRVTSSWVEVEETLQFVRTLYSLEDLVEFELQDDDNHLLAINSDPSATVRPHLPENSLDFQLAVIQPLIDRSVKEVVLRCLQAYVDRVPVDDHRAMLTQEHLTVFQQLVINERHSYKDVDKHITEKNWRPIWEDVMAVYMIEQIIRKSIWGAPKCSVVRLNPPYSFFDQYHYHALLRSVREKATLSALRTDTPLSPKTAVIAESEPVVENPSLPVDEFEDVILESVRKHRVTIIQGDTGCGT